MSIRVFAACAACRLSKALLHMLGRGGTNFPGQLARKLCPGVLKTVTRDMTIIAVTGTNGKTTTCKMLASALERDGQTICANRTGANLAAGITAELIMNATLTGKAKQRWAVIECDEGALKQVTGDMRPSIIVVTNVFRDQLDRYGEVTHTLESIRLGIEKAPQALVCLNADCSLTASLAGTLPNKVVYFGVNVPLGSAAAVSDAPRCIRCGAEYTYSFHTYAHLGGFSCPECGYRRPDPQLAITAITAATADGTEVNLCWNEKNYQASVPLPTACHVYNAAAALGALGAAGQPMEACIQALGSMQAGFGRMEKLQINQTTVRIILVKNPAGCDAALDYLGQIQGEYLPIFCLNDNTPDGTDVSWIYDADYERYVSAAGERTAWVYGIRAGDMALRLKYAGLPEDRIKILDSLDALTALVQSAAVPVYVLPNYTSMLEVRDKLAELAGGEKYWK